MLTSQFTLPPSVTLTSIQKLRNALAAREQLLRRIITAFERQYAGTLDDLNRRLAACEIAEHPAWEDAIEWGNALDQLAQVQLTQGIAAWLTNLLKPSSAS
jgi:hypothetical protein